MLFSVIPRLTSLLWASPRDVERELELGGRNRDERESGFKGTRPRPPPPPGTRPAHFAFISPDRRLTCGQCSIYSASAAPDKAGIMHGRELMVGNGRVGGIGRASERGRKFSLFASPFLPAPSPHYFLSLPLHLVPPPLPEKSSCDEIVGAGTIDHETQARLD